MCFPKVLKHVNMLEHYYCTLTRIPPKERHLSTLFKLLNVLDLNFYHQRSNHLIVHLPLQKKAILWNRSLGMILGRWNIFVPHCLLLWSMCVFTYSQVKVRELKRSPSYYFPLINNRNFSVLVNIFSFKCIKESLWKMNELFFLNNVKCGRKTL